MNYYTFPEMSCVMTPQLMALGEEAILAYELACADATHRLPDVSETPCSNMALVFNKPCPGTGARAPPLLLLLPRRPGASV